MTRNSEHGPSGSNDRLSTLKKFGIGVTALGIAAGSSLGLTGCGDKVQAQPNEPTPASSAPVTPGASESSVSTTGPEQTPDTPSTPPSTMEVSQSPAPTSETSNTPIAEVPSFREWNIAPDTSERLQAAETDIEKWAILKEIIQNNNEPGSYDLDTSLESRDIESMVNRTAIELATMADIGQDPNVKDGDIISQTWAELAIIDEVTRDKFIDLTSNMRMVLTTSDQEWVDGMLEIQAKEPMFHLQPDILHASAGINVFHDPDTGEDYNGITFTGIYEVPGNYDGYVTTMTIVLDFGNYATQILREYPESIPGGWEISYNPGEAPIKVSEIPAVQEKTGS